MKYKMGFSLIELLVAVVILGILAAIAIPTYQNYTTKARYTEIMNAATPFKLGVAECALRTHELKNCANGKNGVPPADKENGSIKSVTVSATGTITVTPSPKTGYFKSTDTYVLAPTLTETGKLTWEIDKNSGCIEKGLC